MVKDRVPVNLADPKDIRAKMPEIRQLLANAREELDALKEQVEMLTRIVGDEPLTSAKVSVGSSITGRSRKMPKRSSAPKAAPSQERAVRALERAGRPMGPASLFRFMEAQGMDRPRNVAALNAVLWAASKAGRVVKASNGVYAPPGFPTDRPLTDYDEARREFPVPASLGGNDVADQASLNGAIREGENREIGLESGSRGGPG